MTLRLSSEQQRALDLSRPVFLSAGAGSGKTGVLIERYLRALEDVGFDLGAVLAVTFTKKATAEMVRRVRAEVTARVSSDAAHASDWKRIREELPDAWIMTIDAFCYRVLGAIGPAAGLSPRRRIFTGGALAEVTQEAMRQVIDRIANDPADRDHASLKVLLEAVGRKGLVARLSLLLERRARARPWARMMFDPETTPDRMAACLAELSGERVAPAGASLALEHGRQVALALLFERLFDRYRELLAAAGGCDFRQLLEDVAEKLSDDRVRRRFASRFRHVLVDEFQDTDPLQWEVFRKLFGERGLERPGLFVVGDEKQAIFSFRDGDVVTFREAGREIAASRGLELTLSDNYRSTPRLVEVFNRLSAVLFSGSREDFEARDAVMAAGRPPGGPGCPESRVEILVGRGADPHASRQAELSAIATRIRRFVDERVGVAVKGGAPSTRPARMEDVAILMRSRVILPALEAALLRRGVPFRVIGGVGFYEQHEVRALCNLMRFLVDDHDDLALLGTLRSALFAIPDSVFLTAVRAPEARTSWSLWRKLAALADAARAGAATLPTPSDVPVLIEAVARLERLRSLADRIPANELLALAVRESDLMLTLAAVDPSGRAVANVEKLLALARRCLAEGIVTLEGIERTIAVAGGRDTDTPEAQADPPASDAVSILTVHAAKGLEWPIVFVPNLEANVKGGGRGDAGPPVLLRSEVSLPLLYEIDGSENDRDEDLHDRLKAITASEKIAEGKRLLYVAATRARDHLVFSAAVPAGKDLSEQKADSWLRWVLAARDDGIPVLDPAPERDPSRAERDRPGVPGASEARTGVAVLGPGRPRSGARPADPGDSPQSATPPATLAIPATALGILRRCSRRFMIEHVIGVSPAIGRPFGSRALGRPDALSRGKAVHASLEGIAFGADPVSRVAGAASRFGIVERAAVERVEAEVRGAMSRFRDWSVGRAILQAKPGEVRAEVPFELGGEGGRIVGAIDLLFEPAAGGSVVIDFKTDTVDGDPLEFSLAHGYVDQVEGYAAAALSRGRTPVSAWLFFTQSGLALPIVGEGGRRSGEAASREVAATLRGAGEIVAAGFPLTKDGNVCASCPHFRRTCPGSA